MKLQVTSTLQNFHFVSAKDEDLVIVTILMILEKVIQSC